MENNMKPTDAELFKEGMNLVKKGLRLLDKIKDDSEKMEYRVWYKRLLSLNRKEGKFGGEHPLGTCVLRDVIRDEDVQKALERAYKVHVFEQPIDFDDADFHCIENDDGTWYLFKSVVEEGKWHQVLEPKDSQLVPHLRVDESIARDIFEALLKIAEGISEE